MHNGCLDPGFGKKQEVGKVARDQILVSQISIHKCDRTRDSAVTGRQLSRYYTTRRLLGVITEAGSSRGCEYNHVSLDNGAGPRRSEKEAKRAQLVSISDSATMFVWCDVSVRKAAALSTSGRSTSYLRSQTTLHP